MRKRPATLTALRCSPKGALITALCMSALAGCAGQPKTGSTGSGSTGSQLLAQQQSAAQAINGVRVTFQNADYYGLTNPNAEGCAGDARNFYDPVALTAPNASGTSAGYASSSGIAGLSVALGASGPTGPMVLPQDVSQSDQTIRPAFIKNISVDLTDANASVTANLAAGCSLGKGNLVPATSSCSTFDYGAVGGIPSTLGGTMMIIGGVQSYNYSGILPSGYQTSFPSHGMSLGCGPVVNQSSFAASGTSAPVGYTPCNSGVFALGVNTLPASAFQSNPNLTPSYLGTQGPTGAVSMWANISGTQGYTGPAGGAGASTSYDAGLQQVLLFGGAAPLSGFGSNAPGVTTYDTWTFDLKSQQWHYLTANIYIDNSITTLHDELLDIEKAEGTLQANIPITPTQIQKNIGARSIMGYLAVPGMGMDLKAGLNSTGVMTSSMIDKTDRLVVVGGFSGEVLTGTHRFNPTYGPDIENVVLQVGGANSLLADVSQTGLTSATPAALMPVQWIDSYHTQLMNNSYGANFIPTNPAPVTAPVVAGNNAATSFTDLSSRFTPDLPPLAVGPTGGEKAVINSAFVPVVNNGGAGTVGTGYILATGGFDYSSPTNNPDTQTLINGGDDASQAVCTATASATVQRVVAGVSPWSTNTDLRCGGGLSIQTRYYLGKTQVATANEGLTSNWGAVPNTIDPNGLPNAPALWTQFREDPIGADFNDPSAVAPTHNNDFLEFLGGQAMIPGFDLSNNDVVIFGGLDCRSYVSDTTAPCKVSVGAGNTSKGRYYQMGPSPAQAIQPQSILSPKFIGAGPVTLASNVKQDQLAISNGGSRAGTTAATWATNSDPTKNTMPYQAGAATARGLDPNGNVVILSWGGATGGGTVEGQNKIYYLTNTTSAPFAPGQSTWGFASPAGASVLGDVPSELINSTMVFSHVTRKFYVFGGYDPSVQLTRGDTYEITLAPNGSGTACTLGATAPGGCIFKWRKLNQTTGTGLTCYPHTCPTARRSHRIAEVNYYNRNPGGINGAAAGPQVYASGYAHNGEQPCTPQAPCSYGIFMEGGTPDGLNFLSDRWMFDPTANEGNGHWQLMTELPPRALAAMASIDYTLPTNSQVLHRAILFGGETGLHNTQWASTGTFVAPTLGDTWMFDFDSQSWNRVQLQGQGFDVKGSAANNLPGQNSTTGVTSGTEFTRRQAYDVTTTPGSAQFSTAGDLGASYWELSPPALAGAVMISRTLAPPAATAGYTNPAASLGVSAPTSPLHVLPIPEVYLFGGRLKDGSFNPLSNVYKFCAGSTGEAFTTTPAGVAQATSSPNPMDFTCDAFDLNNPNSNPLSPSPVSGYVGRWITKNPTGITTTGAALATANFGAYLGAGAYDSVRDRIVLFGGLTSLAALTPGTTAVTDTANLIADASVFEYTPPQPQLANPNDVSPLTQKGAREGRWTFVPACAGVAAPVGRYGHSMAFNTFGQNIILMGGYGADGTPLTTPILDQSSNTTYNSPQIWTGTYCSDASCDSKLPTNPNLTNAPCYYWQPVTVFGNSTAIQAQLPPETGIGHAASVYIPATGYNTGYYSMFDSACANEGPIAAPDPSLNKLLAGGAYIDIDRSALGASENLLLNITYMPMGTGNLNPDASAVTTDQSAVFRVHLIKTGQSQQQLEAALQPRYMGYADTQQYPKIVQSLSVLAPPSGQIAQEQVMLPITVDPGIDRIRIERYSGSGILLDAAVYRMGSK